MLQLISDHRTQPRPRYDTSRLLRAASGSFSSDRQCLERARGWIRARLNRTPHASALDGILVALNEAATNAIEHSTSGKPGGSFTITLTWDDATLRVSVSDQGGSTFPTSSSATDDEPEGDPIDDLVEHGRGLAIIEAMSSRWGWQSTAFGTETWFELDLPVAERLAAKSTTPHRLQAVGV
ncbi:MAG: ATP-binding protein [Streptosporangiaceae bacterium]